MTWRQGFGKPGRVNADLPIRTHLSVKERRMADLDAAWTRLEAAAKAAGEKRIVEFFDAEPRRLETLTLDVAGLHIDLSKQAWDEAGLEAALDLAHAADVEGARAAMFGGEAINSSEGRAVLHTALRAKADADFKAGGVPVMAEVEAVRARMKAFAEAVRSGEIKGATGKPFKAILHIGIGGSDLGPRLLWDALRPVKPSIDLRFVANVDGAEFALTTADMDPEETLVIVVSKTFTTQETLANAGAARAWLAEALGETGANAAPGRHLDRPGQDRGLRRGRRPGVRLLGLGGRSLFAVVVGQPVGRRGLRLGRVPGLPGRRRGHGRALPHRLAGRERARC
jgi:hypothetical protein